MTVLLSGKWREVSNPPRLKKRRMNIDDEPDDKEVGRGGVLPEERGLDEVVVKRRLSLTVIKRDKGTDRRLVLRVDDSRFSEFKLIDRMDQSAITGAFVFDRHTLGTNSSLSSVLR